MSNRICLYPCCVDNLAGRSAKAIFCSVKHKNGYYLLNAKIDKIIARDKNIDERELRKLAKQYNVTEKYLQSQLQKGARVEKEHTTNNQIATEIALDHLHERPDYYDMLEKAEKTPIVVDEKLAGGGSVDSDTDQQIMANYPRLTKGQAATNYKLTQDVLASKEALTPQTRKILEQYEGRGGVVESGKTDEGLVHQFYTPFIVCKKMYELAAHYGFNGGNVLEPACGTGRFFKFTPANTTLFGFDLDADNIKIANKLYPSANLYQQSFETAFLQPPQFNKALKKSWLPEMDLVIGNPPYGDYLGYYKSYMPSKYKRFEFLFIRLGLQLLAPGGLLIYIVSQNVMSNGAQYNKMKEDILEIGEFVDAIRLPGSIFTGTTIGTDIVIFKRK